MKGEERERREWDMTARWHEGFSENRRGRKARDTLKFSLSKLLDGRRLDALHRTVPTAHTCKHTATQRPEAADVRAGARQDLARQQRLRLSTRMPRRAGLPPRAGEQLYRGGRRGRLFIHSVLLAVAATAFKCGFAKSGRASIKRGFAKPKA